MANKTYYIFDEEFVYKGEISLDEKSRPLFATRKKIITFNSETHIIRFDPILNKWNREKKKEKQVRKKVRLEKRIINFKDVLINTLSIFSMKKNKFNALDSDNIKFILNSYETDFVLLEFKNSIGDKTLFKSTEYLDEFLININLPKGIWTLDSIYDSELNLLTNKDFINKEFYIS